MSNLQVAEMIDLHKKVHFLRCQDIIKQVTWPI